MWRAPRNKFLPVHSSPLILSAQWCPVATHSTLQARARILGALRIFFAARDVLEVETPLLCAASATAPHLQSFVTRHTGPAAPRGQTMYLQTSPEFTMKRLLAAGSGPIFQVCKAFRDGESGRAHNPEFTLLEWYRPGFLLTALMDEVEELVRILLADKQPAQASERLSYGHAFARHAGIDVFQASLAELQDCARDHAIELVPFPDAGDRDVWLDLLLTHVVAPGLPQGQLCFIFDYPASQAALAQIRHEPGAPAIAERFELYVNGFELASGYHELADSHEQRGRFEHDRARRVSLQADAIPMDDYLLAALDYLPECSGVALGLDRLLMLAVGASHIDEVLAFPVRRA